MTCIDLSVVIEWENVLISEDERCFAMLRQLRKQLSELNQSAEVIVLFNRDQLDRAEIELVLREHFGASDTGDLPELRLEETWGTRYYELKNEGAARARGQIVVFLDSDVVPEEGWARELTEPFFDRPDVDVVAGHTHVAHGNLHEKAFALGWFFPLRISSKTVHSDGLRFFANNVAFRRDVILKYPFPKIPPGVTRGACGLLARQLTSSGITIWTNTAARADHPPPTDLRHFIIRAMAHGRDIILSETAAGRAFHKALAANVRWSIGRMLLAGLRIPRGHRQVQLALWQAPFAIGLMACFYSLALVGGCVTLISPQFATRHWQI